MMKSKIKAKLKNDELVIGAFVKSSDPSIVEVLGCTGLDFFVLDNEHVALDKSDITNIIRAAECYDIESIVRVTKNNPDYILQVLDAGANGVQVPNIDTYEQAVELGNSSKYKPLGDRGFSPNTRAARYGAIKLHDYIQNQNEETLVVAHCESKESYNNIDEILKVDAIDVIFIGPMDLSQSFGVVGNLDDPQVSNCIKEVCEKTRKAGKAVGIVTSVKNVKKYTDMGMRYMLIGNDQGCIMNHFTNVVKEVSEKVKGE